MTNAQLAWHRSSYGSGQGGNCVETAGLWRKSSYSSAQDGNCIETSPYLLPHAIAVRDSKDTAITHLRFARTAWAFLVSEIQVGH